MRVAVVNYSNRKLGGTEHYLEVVLRKLADVGIALAFLHENEQPNDRAAIAPPAGVPTWCVEAQGTEATLEGLRAWKPDLLYCHGELDPSFEARLLALAPSVYFSHNYYGTCISGQKAFQLPEARPCGRRFGPMCLALYFPRKCGGMNPVTMLTRYRRSAQRLEVLRCYDALITHSDHLRAEYINHGFEPRRVYNLKYEVSPKSDLPPADAPGAGMPLPPDSWRLMFAGRMERLKGGRTLLRSLPRIAQGLGRPVHLELVGDGADRAAWEFDAARVQSRDSRVRVDFPGWLIGEEFDRHVMATHLMVMPSLWPEPFGKSGLEAGLFGVPSAAFRVGGIPEWLRDGVNGHLAPGEPPTEAGLAEAIVACLRDPRHYRDLRAGARRVAEEFNLDQHVESLLGVFDEVVASRR